MSEPLPDTWHQRDLPVLRAVVRRYDEDGDHIGIKAVVDDTGLSFEDVQRAARALADAYLVETWKVADGSAAFFQKVSAEARQLAGSWPTAENVADRLIASLEQQISDAPNDEQRGKLRTAVNAIKDLSRQVIVRVGTDIVSGQIPT